MTDNFGTLVVNERVWPIKAIWLGEEAFNVLVSIPGAEALAYLSTGERDWTLHAPDGTFVTRGRIRFEVPPLLTARDTLDYTLHLFVRDKLTDGLRECLHGH